MRELGDVIRVKEKSEELKMIWKEVSECEDRGQLVSSIMGEGTP